jgi:hypothetical protein
LSENNQFEILPTDTSKATLLANVASRYRLGRNFEPQTYFTVLEAPWCSQILLEYSFDDINWLTAVYDSDHDELLEFSLARTVVVEA